ncbi:hypothetical protein D3C71_1735880 [compost metagenome]
MAAFQPFNHFHGVARKAIFQTRDAHAARIVRTAEDELAFAIGGDVRRAARERRFGGIGQGTIVRCNAVGQYAKLRTHAYVQKTFIRADNHRLHLSRHINNLHQRERAFRIQTPDVDLLALRTGGINGLFHEYSSPHCA